MDKATKFKKMAAGLLNRGGSQGTLIQVTKWPYNPVTGETPETVDTFPVQVSNPSHVERWENGSLVRMGEDSMFIGSEGLPVVPVIGDRITINEVEWTVTKTETIQVQNVPIVYQCFVKK